jgi:hypothetical protein
LLFIIRTSPPYELRQDTLKQAWDVKMPDKDNGYHYLYRRVACRG